MSQPEPAMRAFGDYRSVATAIEFCKPRADFQPPYVGYRRFWPVILRKQPRLAWGISGRKKSEGREPENFEVLKALLFTEAGNNCQNEGLTI